VIEVGGQQEVVIRQARAWQVAHDICPAAVRGGEALPEARAEKCESEAGEALLDHRAGGFVSCAAAFAPPQGGVGQVLQVVDQGRGREPGVGRGEIRQQRLREAQVGGASPASTQQQDREAQGQRGLSEQSTDPQGGHDNSGCRRDSNLNMRFGG